MSPAFDLNPEPEIDAHRVTSINFVEDAVNALAELRASAHYFRLSPGRAEVVLQDVLDGTRNWREVARGNNVKESDIRRFAPALDRFRLKRLVLSAGIRREAGARARDRS